MHLDVSDAEKCKIVAADIAAEHDGTINTVFNCAAYFGSQGKYCTARYVCHAHGWANYFNTATITKCVKAATKISLIIAKNVQW
mgnify:FL=1